MSSKIEPSPELVREQEIWDYPNRLLALEGGNILVRLFSDPKIAVRPLNPGTLECSVLDWGITFRPQQAAQLPTLMSRRFLELFSRADSGTLSEQDEAVWGSILRNVDYASFCSDRAAPQYMEGTVTTIAPNFTVEWHDGDVEILAPNAAAALSLLNPGEMFGAYAKLDRRGKVIALERLVTIQEE